MAEVISISGPPGSGGGYGYGSGYGFRGGFGASCPPGWQATPNGNCGAPTSGCSSSMKVSGGSACRSQSALSLQQSLAAMGAALGDKTLAAVGIDGIIGPGTAAAVNRAFTTHIGSGQAPASFRTGQLSIYQVAQNAIQLAELVTTEIKRRGAKGLVPVPAPAPSPAPSYPPAPPGMIPGTGPAPSAPGQDNTLLWALAGLAVVVIGVGVYMNKQGGGGEAYEDLEEEYA